MTPTNAFSTAMPTIPTIDCDVVIVGAGIAGLWALHKLSQQGLSVLLLESQAIGSGQTIKSQGIIHGGLKYALGGTLSSASEAIADMPNRWQACLEGKGEISLQKARVLSHAQYLWSPGSLSGQLMSFFASKTLKSRVQSLNRTDYPAVFQHEDFKGKVYQLAEWVLDIPSVLSELSKPFQSQILKINELDGYDLEYAKDDDITVPTSSTSKPIDSLVIHHQDRRCRLKARFYIFTTGSHNQSLTHDFPELTPTQERPLHMVWGTFPQGVNPQLYGHCLDRSLTPRVTITTHQNQAGQTVWYLGGQIAEIGVNLSVTQQIAYALEECLALFPWMDFTRVSWDTLRVNRAEPKQANGQKPDAAFVHRAQNILLGWPTKLAMAPMLADQIWESIKNDFSAKSSQSSQASNLIDMLQQLAWPCAALSKSPWDK